jgi:hypothetical protein
MTTYPSNDIRILILRQDETIWLISPVALDRACDVMFGLGKLKREYIGSKIISSNGCLEIIKNINKGKLLGTTNWEKFESILAGAYEIIVELSQEKRYLSINEIKNILAENIKSNYDHYREDHFFSVSENKSIAVAEILKNLGAAENYTDIISAFGYTEENCDCLDGL